MTSFSGTCEQFSSQIHDRKNWFVFAYMAGGGRGLVKPYIIAYQNHIFSCFNSENLSAIADKQTHTIWLTNFKNQFKKFHQTSEKRSL